MSLVHVGDRGVGAQTRLCVRYCILLLTANGVCVCVCVFVCVCMCVCVCACIILSMNHFKLWSYYPYTLGRAILTHCLKTNCGCFRYVPSYIGFRLLKEEKKATIVPRYIRRQIKQCSANDRDNSTTSTTNMLRDSVPQVSEFKLSCVWI